MIMHWCSLKIDCTIKCFIPKSYENTYFHNFNVTHATILVRLVLILPLRKNKFSSTMAMGIPCRSATEAMMTMATLTVDRTIPWCPSLPPTTSSSSITMPALNIEKFDACSNKQQSFSTLMTLREIPTREFQPDSTDAVIDPLNDGDDDCNNTKPTTLPPTASAGTAAPLPYQLEIAAITAKIAHLKQRDDNSFVPNRQMTPTTNIQSALDELAAKINTIATNRPAVPLQLAATNLPEPTPMPVSTTANLSHDDDVSNHPLDA